MSRKDDQFDEITTEFVAEDDDSRALRWLSLVVVFIAIAGFIGLAWYAYNAGVEGDPESVELVEADDSPVRETPQDPGGMEIPHQDKTIYEEISGNDAPEGAERILPAPEEPTSTPPAEQTPAPVTATAPAPVEATPPTAAAPTNASGEVLMSGSESLKKEEPAAAEPAPEAKKVETPAAMPEEKPAPPVAEVKPVEEAKPAEPKPTEVKPAPEEKTPAEEKKIEQQTTSVAPAVASEKSGKPARAQLGSYKSDIEAKMAWTTLAKKHKELADRTYDVVTADLGAKGIYYRLQVLKLTVESASELCNTLKTRKQPCMVVK